MLRGIWKQLTVLTLCICLFCMGTVACLAEDMTEEPAVDIKDRKLTEEELVQIVRFACTAASLSTQTHGGIASVPELAAVEQKMEAANG